MTHIGGVQEMRQNMIDTWELSTASLECEGGKHEMRQGQV